MRTIPLHGKKANGRVALVDDEDYERVMQYRWHIKLQEGARHKTPAAYVQANLKRPDGSYTTILMHKLITGWPQTDHKDHDGLNNQRSNLRAATDSQNGANQRPTGRGLSRYKGVSQFKGSTKWHAHIAVERKKIYLGQFADEAGAARAHDAAAVRFFGEYACLNLPGLSLVSLERLARPCVECEQPIPESMRSDARYCSQECRKVAGRRRQAPRRRELHGWRKRAGSRY